MFKRKAHKRQTIVVTGASAGVGRAVAIAFARRGCRIALLARGQAGLMAAARDVAQAGGEALALEVDMTDPGAVFAAAHEVERTLGPIDIWINNAMATVFGPIESISPDEFKRVMDVTFHGYVHGALAALRVMRPRDRGLIVQIGSALAYRAIPLQGAYCAAKFAVRGFTDSLRSELLHDGSAIRMTAVHLPAVNTPQFEWSRSKIGRRHKPLGAVYEPEAIAEAVVHATRWQARDYWLGWSTAQPILGEMFAPGLLDRYLANVAYDQVTNRPASPRDILYQPAGRDHGARGFHGPAARRIRILNPAYLRAGTYAIAGLLALGAWTIGTRGCAGRNDEPSKN